MRLVLFVRGLRLAIAASLPALMPGIAGGDDGVPIAVIVPLEVAAEAFTANDLALIYRRKKQFWSDRGRILPVNLPVGSSVRQRFSRVALGESPEELEDYWNEQYFQGVLPPHVLASEAAVLRFVAETKNSVGYLPYCGVDVGEGVRVVLVIDAKGQIVGPKTSIDCSAP